MGRRNPDVAGTVREPQRDASMRGGWLAVDGCNVRVGGVERGPGRRRHRRPGSVGWAKMGEDLMFQRGAKTVAIEHQELIQKKYGLTA